MTNQEITCVLVYFFFLFGLTFYGWALGAWDNK